MQKDEEEYHELCAEIVKEIVASYKEKTGIQLGLENYRYESTIDLNPSGDQHEEIVYATFYKPGQVSFSFFGSLPSESYCLADPLFFEKTTKRLQEMVEYIKIKKEESEFVLNVLKSGPEQESRPQP